MNAEMPTEAEARAGLERWSAWVTARAGRLGWGGDLGRSTVHVVSGAYVGLRAPLKTSSANMDRPTAEVGAR